MEKIYAERCDAAVSDCLKRGGVVLVPTDTVYGLAALPSCDSAVDKVFRLKGRPRQRNLPIMVASGDDLAGLGCVLNERVEKILRSPFVPGALTFVVGVDDALAPAWLKGREEIAIRIPDRDDLLAVIREVGPLFVTSANRHGFDTPTHVAAVIEQLDGSVDLVIDGGTIDFVPSTLVNCREAPITIERHGKIPAASIIEFMDRA